MKIEMGESLAASWLKHICGCTIVQTNWKPSSRWHEHNIEEIERLVQDGRVYFNALNLNIFKQNDNVVQILEGKRYYANNCDSNRVDEMSADTFAHCKGRDLWRIEEMIKKCITKWRYSV